MVKIALIVDVKDWAFYNIATNLVKYLSDEFEFVIIPLEDLKGNIVEGLIKCKDYQIIHFFWRGYLNLLGNDFANSYIRNMGLDVEKFYYDHFYSKIITTAIYDHLFIESEFEVTQKANSLLNFYYTSSKKLFNIYNRFIELKKPSCVLTDGVDLSKFYPKNITRLYKRKSNKLVIGWVGNSAWGPEHTDTKGVNTILKPAISSLVSQGYDIEMNFADKQIKMISHDKMIDYYSEIDLYICTSEYEGTPNPILEAMACGLPIISTDVGIVSEAFGKHQSKFILEKRSVECLEEKIKYIYKKKRILKKLSRENLKSIKSWDWKIKTEGFRVFFREALNSDVNE
jgi:glycosyltransferase involved in cell wall biosynthesis